MFSDSDSLGLKKHDYEKPEKKSYSIATFPVVQRAEFVMKQT